MGIGGLAVKCDSGRDRRQQAVANNKRSNDGKREGLYACLCKCFLSLCI